MDNMNPQDPWIKRIAGVAAVILLVMVIAVTAVACQNDRTNDRGDISEEMPSETTSAMPSPTTTPTTTPTTAPVDYIDKEAAKQVAFEHAGIKTDDAAKVRCKLKSNNSGEYYEVTFVVDRYEYEYDIDAVTGAIIENSREWQDTVDWGDGDWGDDWHLGEDDDEDTENDEQDWNE